MTPSAPPTITLQMAASLEDVTRKGVPHVVDFIVLQLNDAYEAAPVEAGKLGGLARVATLCRQLKQENPNFFSVMVGDFLSPSAIGATTNDAGIHMVEALNAMGLDYATMGNHEFDVAEDQLKLRIAESRFQWIVSNVQNVTDTKTGAAQPFEHVAEHAVIEFANASGEKVRVALIGVCLDMVKKPWLKYQNSIESARAQVAALDGKVDVVLAMTHLTIQEDMQLGTAVPRLDVLLGGHEHEAARAIVGDDATPIFKADSNARSGFVHRFRFDTQTGVTLLFPELVKIDASFAEEPETAAIVHKWEEQTYATLRAQGNDPLEVVGRATEALNGYEAAVRNGPTNLTQLIVEAFLAAVPGADAVVFTAGLIRIDGIIPPGDVTYFDIVRIFPSGGKLSVFKTPGGFLRTLIDMGVASKGGGGFQALANIRKDATGGWLVKDAPLDDAKVYTIVMSELPASALANPPFKGSGMEKLYDTRDIRAILTDRLRRDLDKPSA